MRVVAGVDCHKASHTVVFLDAVGHRVAHCTIPTTEAGYQAAIAKAEQLGCTEWGIEGSGCYGFAFAVYARAAGATVVEVPGAYTKRHRRHASRRGKSDEHDAQAVAEVVLREPGRLPHFYPAQVQRALRLRYDQRDRFVRERTRAANRLRSAAVLLGVMQLPAVVTSTRTAKRLASLAGELRATMPGQVAAAALLDDIEDAAEDIVRLNTKIRAVMHHLRPVVREVASTLLAVHGISDVVAAGLVGHTGDIRNCRSAAGFAMKCGVAPVPCSSGRNHAVRVNTGGDRQLNRLLHVVAMSQVRRADHPGQRYYDRKRAEGKTHLAAMRCLKRQLATVIYYRLRADATVLTTTDMEWPTAA